MKLHTRGQQLLCLCFQDVVVWRQRNKCHRLRASADPDAERFDNGRPERDVGGECAAKLLGIRLDGASIPAAVSICR
jgi:hypothetical protein